MIAAAFWEWSLWVAAIGVWLLICSTLAGEVLHAEHTTSYRVLCMGGLAVAVYFLSVMLAVMW